MRHGVAHLKKDWLCDSMVLEHGMFEQGVALEALLALP